MTGEGESEEGRVIGVSDYGGYYTIRTDPSDPVQAALNTAEVDRVDLMQFQVLNTGDIVYERADIGPPPPLFEDPNIIKVRQEHHHHLLLTSLAQDQYERESPMYTTLEPASGNTAASYTNLQLAPTSPSKYYSPSTTLSSVPPYSPSSYQYPGHYSRSSYPGHDVLSSLYPGYSSGQFSYDNIGHSLYDTSNTAKTGYGGIYVPSAALPSQYQSNVIRC